MPSQVTIVSTSEAPQGEVRATSASGHDQLEPTSEREDEPGRQWPSRVGQVAVGVAGRRHVGRQQP